jgi:hypothetical protein
MYLAWPPIQMSTSRSCTWTGRIQIQTDARGPLLGVPAAAMFNVEGNRAKIPDFDKFHIATGLTTLPVISRMRPCGAVVRPLTMC